MPGKDWLQNLGQISERLKDLLGKLENADEMVEKELDDKDTAKKVDQEKLDLEAFRKDIDNFESKLDQVAEDQANVEEVDQELLVLANEAVEICEEHQNIPILLAKIARHKKQLNDPEKADKIKGQIEMILRELVGVIELLITIISGEGKYEYQSEEKKNRGEELKNTAQELEEFKEQFIQAEEEEIENILSS